MMNKVLLLACLLCALQTKSAELDEGTQLCFVAVQRDLKERISELGRQNDPDVVNLKNWSEYMDLHNESYGNVLSEQDEKRRSDLRKDLEQKNILVPAHCNPHFTHIGLQEQGLLLLNKKKTEDVVR
jgi:hypothetical protein